MSNKAGAVQRPWITWRWRDSGILTFPNSRNQLMSHTLPLLALGVRSLEGQRRLLEGINGEQGVNFEGYRPPFCFPPDRVGIHTLNTAPPKAP